MVIDASRLRIDLEEDDNWRRTLNVTVPGDIVQQQRSHLVARIAGRMKLKGFRSGRVPGGVVEKRYGPALDKEAVDTVIGEAYREALKLQEITPISQGELASIDYDPPSDLTFSISFDVRPVLELHRLGGFRVLRPRAEVADDQVSRVVERLRAQAGKWRAQEEGAAQDGDLVKVSVERLDGEEALRTQDYELIVGQGDALPDVEEAIRTLAPGSEGTFVVRFPDDIPDEDRRGEEQELRITLLSRHVRELPELDDDFARSVGDFSDLDELRRSVREDLEKEASRQAEAVVRVRLLDSIIEANPVSAPQSMVDRYLDEVIGDTEGKDEARVEEARRSLRPEAERAVKRILVVDRVAEMQGLEATEADLDERVEEIASRSDVQVAEVYAQLQKSGRLQSIERDITEKKVFDFLQAESEIVNEE